jgi:toxin FitB
MGSRFLIDTNTMIYYFDGKFTDQKHETIHRIFQSSFCISVISKIEFLGWDKFSDDIKVRARNFIDNAEVFLLSEDIVEETINLKNSKRIKLPDAVIAATCLVHGHTIVTRNTKDFSGIKNLKIYNPFNIENG